MGPTGAFCADLQTGLLKTIATTPGKYAPSCAEAATLLKARAISQNPLLCTDALRPDLACIASTVAVDGKGFNGVPP
jgi:hypothetical protein